MERERGSSGLMDYTKADTQGDQLTDTHMIIEGGKGRGYNREVYSIT